MFRSWRFWLILILGEVSKKEKSTRTGSFWRVSFELERADELV
jgi:hypothetical protein